MPLNLHHNGNDIWAVWIYDVFVTEWPLMAGRPSHFNILHCNPGVADIMAWLKTQDAYSTLANKTYYPFPHF